MRDKGPFAVLRCLRHMQKEEFQAKETVIEKGILLTYLAFNVNELRFALYFIKYSSMLTMYRYNLALAFDNINAVRLLINNSLI